MNRFYVDRVCDAAPDRSDSVVKADGVWAVMPRQRLRAEIAVGVQGAKCGHDRAVVPLSAFVGALAVGMAAELGPAAIAGIGEIGSTP